MKPKTMSNLLYLRINSIHVDPSNEERAAMQLDTREFSLGRITKVYFGGDNVCRCGCAGEYLYPEEVGFSRRVKRLVDMVNKDKGHDIYDGGTYINVVTSLKGIGKALTIYFD